MRTSRSRHASPRHRLLRSVTPLLALLVALPLMISAGPATATDAEQPESVVIEVLSTRADAVTGGSAYLEVTAPADADLTEVEVSVDDRDVTDAFAVRDNGRYLGVVEDLELGDNVVTARLPDGRGAELTVTNHPIEGPVFSGPHIQPWNCDSGAEDVDTCNREASYEFLYQSSNPLRSGWQDYDPDDPPDDVATTTTDEGHEVPFIVRVERGVTVRDNYAIAVLYDPEQDWEPWAPQESFNHKLVITHGASCDTSYRQGSAPSVLNEDVLGAGYAVMSHALNNAGHNCNVVTQAESMIVTKEHLIETYGELRHTIGTGCSGGGLAQYQVANAYPGLYQGITPACSYPDAWSSAMQYVDYDGMLEYFGDPGGWGTGVVWEQTQIEQVIGHPNITNPITFTTVIPNSGHPDRSCPGVPSEDVYDREDNPGGVRCTLHDYMINVFGELDESDETIADLDFDANTFARRPAGNEGVLYGLEGLLAGTLLPQNFVDINTKIGGVDEDYQPIVERVSPDPVAVERAYRSGAVTTASNLDEVAIIDLRGPDPGAFHDVYRTYALRERLIREHGHAENQLIWRGPVALFGDVTFVNESIFAMSEWLDAVEADDRDVPRSQKLVDSRPHTVTNRCTDGAGNDVLPALFCDLVVEAYSTPRQEAGMPPTDDVLACELKPLRRADFHGVDFSDDQWEALEETFPTGVCDYTRPDPSFTQTVPWLTYQDADGEVIHGGEPMGDPPASEPLSEEAQDDPQRPGPPADRGPAACPHPRSDVPACRDGGDPELEPDDLEDAPATPSSEAEVDDSSPLSGLLGR
jgi:hypothetical protein